MVQQWHGRGMAMKRVKEWLHNFWWEFKQDPFGFLLLWFFWLFIILFVALLAFIIYLACTGQIQLKDTGGGSHGINLIPMYNGDNVTFLPMPY